MMASYKIAEGLSVLDNPAWHALNTHHAQFAEGTNLAKRYPAEVSAFSAVVDHSQAAFNDLTQLVTKGHTIRLAKTQLLSEPLGWTINRSFIVNQMVCEQPVVEPKSDVQIVDLSESDVPQMLALVELTHPGPFAPRTIALGHYIGIRQQGRLVAMAGERFHLTGYHEISAVCTAPDHQGKGYARLLISRLVNENWQRGNVPFLHVAADNVSAYHLYESLHFRKRAELYITVLTR